MHRKIDSRILTYVRSPRWWYGAAVAAGTIAAAAYALSPLTIWMTLAAAAVVWFAGRGLPDNERRWLQILLGTAIGIRFAVVAVVFLLSEHDTQGTLILSGDEAYTLGRTLRLRNLLLGLPGLKYDYVIAFDLYGQTSYLAVMTVAQLLFGPSPYGLRLLNVMLFVAGAAILFRTAHHSFGRLPAFAGLTVLLFLPTLFLWSISLLKESLYFFLAASILASTLLLLRSPRKRWRIAAAIVIALGLVALRDLRAGAIALVVSGILLGLGLHVLTTSRARFITGVAVLTLALGIALSIPAIQSRVVDAVEQAANVHIGHVFTIGHHYKLLDEGFYISLNLDPVITAPEAARFVVRGVISFLIVPLGDGIATRGELALLPDIALWYALLLLVPFGLRAAHQSDALLTCLLIGYVVPTGIVVALTNGNVGTLLRFRGLVLPYLVWLAGVGFCVMIQRIGSPVRPIATGASLAGDHAR